MLRSLIALFVAVHMAGAADDLSVKALTRKAVERDIAIAFRATPPPRLTPKLQVIQVHVATPETRVCAIRLKEVHAGDGRRIDPMAMPTGPRIFDNIGHAPPIPACPSQ